MTNIQVIGSGVVGFTTGRGFLEKGHSVTFYDISSSRLEDLRGRGYETTRRLRSADIHFICVPDESIDSVMGDLDGVSGLPVIRSTFPSTLIRGTVQLMSKYHRHIAHNPEFLRENTALQDFMNPFRIVIGECCEEHGDLLENLYRSFNRPIVRVKPDISELVKWMSNCHLSTLISFWNEMYSIADEVGVDPFQVSDIVRLDPRISEYGTVKRGAFGGKCLPKDLDTLIEVSHRLSLNPVLLEAVRDVNKREEEKLPPHEEPVIMRHPVDEG